MSHDQRLVLTGLHVFDPVPAPPSQACSDCGKPKRPHALTRLDGFRGERCPECHEALLQSVMGKRLVAYTGTRRLVDPKGGRA